MAKTKLLTSVAFTAALLGGGVAGAILGVPGVSGAQTTTVPNGPATTVPGGSQTTPDQPHAGGHCQNMGGTAPGGTAPGGQAPAAGSNTGSGSNLAYHYRGYRS